MSDPSNPLPDDVRPEESTPDSSNPEKSLEMFTSREPERAPAPVAAWAIAGIAFLVLLSGLLLFEHGRAPATPNSLQPLAAYAPSLPLTQLAMSESTSLSGGKSTFVDGHIQNTGGQTIGGVMVQVIFHNDEGMPPQIETLPLALIRTRVPYIDTEPVSAAPLKPGDGQDFRLIFETIPQNWNMQMPEVHVIGVTEK